MGEARDGARGRHGGYRGGGLALRGRERKRHGTSRERERRSRIYRGAAEVPATADPCSTPHDHESEYAAESHEARRVHTPHTELACYNYLQEPAQGDRAPEGGGAIESVGRGDGAVNFSLYLC